MTAAEQASEQIRRGRIIPVVRTETAEQALRASDALVDAGVGVLEIAFTVPNALRCVETLADKYGAEVLVGAGTVLDAATCRDAVAAGARFIVSPGIIPDVIAAARRDAVAVLPGALTPTEVLTAWQAGADFVKVFPCDATGGPAYIKSLRGPLPHIPLVPTGGVSLDTAEAFLRAGAVALGLGGELVNLADCRAGQYQKIRERGVHLRRIVEAVALPATSHAAR